MRTNLIYLFLFCFAICIQNVDAELHDQYRAEMIQDIQSGTNYYKLLDVEPSANVSEIRRRGRQMAMKYHPDRNKAENATKMYQKVVFARDVLTDPETKAEYDDLLENGIPAFEALAPSFSVISVTFWLLVFLTASKYAYQWYHYYDIRDRAMRDPRYKNMLKQKQLEKREELKQQGVPANQINVDDVEIEIVGAEKPTWHDLFVVQLVVFPYDPVGKFLYSFFHWLIVEKIMGKVKTPEEREKEMREALGMDEEEWEEHKAKIARYEDQMRTTSKAKRMRRFMKNRVATFYGGED